MLKEVLEYNTIGNTKETVDVTLATGDDKLLESHNRSFQISTLPMIKHQTFLITV